MRRDFVLQPFPDPGTPDVSLGGFVERSLDRLEIVYELSGPVWGVSIPSPSDQPQRKGGLWEHTCFELFLAPADAEAYWEINLSPAGHWNVYHFDGYRSGMREEAAWQSLRFCVERAEDRLGISLAIDPTRIVSPMQRLDVGVSAVVLPAFGLPSYWALCHKGPKPDFHRRDGFLLSL